ncbi:MAG: M28 family peptidase [Bacteroidia bacterium]|nr:M28 family peptidase [Bacteroidia bacterium]
MKKIVFILSFFLAFSCNGPADNPEDPEDPEVPVVVKLKVNYPDFNSDSAYSLVAKQVAFGPRVPGTAQHLKCFNFMKDYLLKYSDTVYFQYGTTKTFDNTIIPIKNIIASFNPQSKDRVLLFTHWDTRPFADQDTKDVKLPILGANDGGSGTAILMEMARLFKTQKPGIGVDLIFFDSEDWGGGEMEDSYCLGSQYWGKNQHVPNYTARFGILLDMVGAPGATFGHEQFSEQFRSVIDKVWNAAADKGYSNYFTNYFHGPITDDHFYVNKYTGIPVIDIIHYDQHTNRFGKYWHTHDDNMNAIDKQTLKAVGETLMKVVYEE